MGGGCRPGPGRSELRLDFDATITIAHSEKENAAATWKRTFGFHPLLCFLDRPDIAGGEALAGLLRPGNAGSNTAADHIKVLDMALAALPEHARPTPGDEPGTWAGPRLLARSDSAGATHAFAAACVERGVGFSFGFPVDTRIQRIVDVIPEACWHPALADRPRRRQRPARGRVGGRGHRHDRPDRLAGRVPADPAQGTPAPRRPADLHRRRRTPGHRDPDQHRAGVVPGQAAGLELRHRQHARVEDRIREAKATGLRNLPCRACNENAAWLEVVLTAVDLVAWTKPICFADVPALARCEIAAFRYRVLHVAARITRAARRAPPPHRQDLALGSPHRRRLPPTTRRVRLTTRARRHDQDPENRTPQRQPDRQRPRRRATPPPSQPDPRITATHRLRETNVAGEHKEELVLVLVRMKRRGEPLGGSQLEGGETTLGLVSGRSQETERSVEPESFAVVGP